MRRRYRLLVIAVVATLAMVPVAVGLADAVLMPRGGSRVDDLVLENGSFASFPNGTCPLGGGPVVGANASCRLEAWLENTIGRCTPLARSNDRCISRTMGDMRTIATACESYSIDHVDHPQASSLEELRGLVVPTYVGAIATNDAWGRPLLFASDAHRYRVASSGADACWQRAGMSQPPGGFDAPTNRQLLGDLIRAWLTG